MFTPDKSKWTHCVVIETDPDKSTSEGLRPKMAVRGGRSVDKDGIPSSDPNDIGMGWFPGYAIDPVTGTRLNVMFGEDSWLIGDNGRDMIWNPTATSQTKNGEVVFGGRHWIYVMKTQYDECAYIKSQITVAANASDLPLVGGINVYKTVAWVMQPILGQGWSLFPIADGLIPTETTIKIRVNHAYEQFLANPDLKNNKIPRYTFGTSDIAPVKYDLTTAKNALDTIKIIPNPYYAYSNYETAQLDNEVKIGNLPQKCTISIYSLDGTLVRRYDRDDASSTSLNWDIKNTAGIPVASGIYMIHIDAPGIGEKTLKWFGVMRPIDLDSF